MKLSKKAYYGLRATLALAHAKKPVSIQVLSEQEQISRDYLEKILQTLRKADMVEATRGAHGGYQLKHQNLSAWDVVSALDGPLKIYAPTGQNTLPCFQPTHCQVNTIFRSLEHDLESSLKKINLRS